MVFSCRFILHSSLFIFHFSFAYTPSVMELKRLAALLALLLFLPGCKDNTAQTFSPTDPAADTEPIAYMALTFDDGPNQTYTPRLLDGLKERDVHATFFLIGNLAETNDALVWRIAAEGHQIGNHSYDHAQLSKLSQWETKQDVQKCDEILRDILGQGDYWVRPPYGIMTDAECACMDTPLINWSVDTEDWKSQNVDSILDIVYRDCFDGCIILFHDSYQTSVEAALAAVDHLSAQGVKFVTVGDLFAIKGITPENGKTYRSVK